MTESVVKQQSRFRYSFVILILFSLCMFIQHHWLDFSGVESKEKDWLGKKHQHAAYGDSHVPSLGDSINSSNRDPLILNCIN